MKKFIISLAALAAFSTAAAAAWHENRSDSYVDSSNRMHDDAGLIITPTSGDAIATVGSGWLFANGENVKDAMEVRRFDEKN